MNKSILKIYFSLFFAIMMVLNHVANAGDEIVFKGGEEAIKLYKAKGSRNSIVVLGHIVNGTKDDLINEIKRINELCASKNIQINDKLVNLYDDYYVFTVGIKNDPKRFCGLGFFPQKGEADKLAMLLWGLGIRPYPLNVAKIDNLDFDYVSYHEPIRRL